MTPLLYIGLVGGSGFGKSTLARKLSMAFAAEGYTCAVHSFAEPIRKMLEVLGVDRTYMTDAKSTPIAELCFVDLRRAAQTLGTDWGRDMIDEDIWVRYWTRHIPDAHVVIADDIRFANEAREIRDRGGMLVGLPGAWSYDHASESGIDTSLITHALGERDGWGGVFEDGLKRIQEHNLYGSFAAAIDALRDDYARNALPGETAEEYNARTGKSMGYLRR